MNTLVVKTQAEWDALPKRFSEPTVIEIRSDKGLWLKVQSVPSNSRVEAWGSSRVEARESSRVEARESSRVVARESSRVEAWGSSRVEARESSRVVARGRSTSHHYSDTAPVLHGQSVCYRYPKSPAPKVNDDAIVINAKIHKGTKAWLENEAVLEVDGSVILYKRVSRDYKTQEGTPNETAWTIGSTLTHPAWSPKQTECGGGKFHACSRTYFCDEFRDNDGDIYIAISIKVRDLYAWDNPVYPHKIAFRKGTVLHQVDRWGDEIKGAA